jgi:membrane protease YdiL (CAAX protease family)
MTSRFARAWRRIPADLRAIIAGVAVIAAGTVPWGILVAINVQVLPTIPWTAGIMIAYLVVYARYLNGWGWPSELGPDRRTSFRVSRPSPTLWRWSLIAGGFSAVSFRFLGDVVRRLSPRPEQDLVPPEVLDKVPFATILTLLLMTSLVAGFAEEAGARGFMQAPLERRYGPIIAIGIVAVVFTLMHFRFGVPDPWPWLLFAPLYVLASVIWGILAWRTGSILPGAIWHGLFDAAGVLRYWWGGIPKSVHEVGYDTPFRVEAALALIFAIPSIWAFRTLLRLPAEKGPA